MLFQYEIYEHFHHTKITCYTILDKEDAIVHVVSTKNVEVTLRQNNNKEVTCYKLKTNHSLQWEILEIIIYIYG